MVPSVRFCLLSLLCYLKLVNEPDKSRAGLPVPFPGYVTSPLLQWKDPSSLGWADARLSGASGFTGCLCTALGRMWAPPRHETDGPWRNVSDTKCAETPWLWSGLWGVSVSGSERGRQRSHYSRTLRVSARKGQTPKPETRGCVF